MRDHDEWDDDEDESGEVAGADDEGGEEEIALSAVQAWLDIEGDDELGQAQREALVAIAEEALAMKERREERERQEARSRKLAERERRREQERAEIARQRREAWEREQARRQREEEYRLAQEQAAERQRREAERRAAQERAEARARAERRAAERRAEEARGAALERVPAAPGPPSRARADDEPERMDDDDEADAGEGVSATVTGWEAFEAPAASDREVNDGADEPEPAPTPPPTNDDGVLTGADLADWRKRLGLTQQAAADLLGVRQGTVSKAESRRGGALRAGMGEALAAALRVERPPA